MGAGGKSVPAVDRPGREPWVRKLRGQRVLLVLTRNASAGFEAWVSTEALDPVMVVFGGFGFRRRRHFDESEALYRDRTEEFDPGSD